jgi:hypothetical protein
VRLSFEIWLDMMTVGETRRSSPGPKKKYIMSISKGTVTAMHNEFLPVIPTSDYKSELRKGKPDNKACTGRLYSDIAMMGRRKQFIPGQWISMDVLFIEGVKQKVLDEPARTDMNSKSSRRIGHDFACLGVPKLSF